MEYKSKGKKMSVCLQCGDRIRYGSQDKKFCCEACKTNYHNKLTKESRHFKRMVLSRLNRNYDILESILCSGMNSADMTDLLTMGFSPNIATSYCTLRGHTEYSCFDIKYRLTPSKVTGVSKIQNVSVTLQDSSDVENH